jgi:hypothetical protein
VADRVVFLRPDAERIARAVRTVEAGNRNETPLTFRRVGGEGGKEKVFRVCTFTGGWSINAPKVVVFRGVTTTPNTASAINLFAAVSTFVGTRNCAIAKDGTAWYLIAAQCS